MIPSHPKGGWDHSLPPSHIAPARLFRLFLQRPRPILPIAYRIRGAEHFPLQVRALRTDEINEAVDAAHEVEEPLRLGAYLSELITRSLMSNGSLAFPCGLPELTNAEVIGLGLAVRDAHAIISPRPHLIQHFRWESALKEGARSAENIHDTSVLANCNVYGEGLRAPAPELYFGGSRGDLTHSQWMAFRAARAAYKDLTA